MNLTPGMNLKTLIDGRKLTVKKKLGGGGQGEVFLVGSGREEFVLKWYFPTQSTSRQEKTIRDLVGRGVPKGNPEATDRFVWPLDLVKPNGSNRFGYLMRLIDTKRYRELGTQMRSGRQLPLSTLAEIGYQLSNSFRALHQTGFCYCDISRGNMMFDPSNGNVLICDNDNVGIDGEAKPQVLGTPETMAPEILIGAATPSTRSDLYSLSVLLFQLWMWHHPMHGMKEYNIRSLDILAKKMLYGTDPVFIFDPNNRSNSLPNDPDYEGVKKLWNVCPQSLKELFVRAFTVGIRSPEKRVVEGEWQRAFLQLKEAAIGCPKCGAHLLWESGDGNSKACWNCRNVGTIAGRLEIDTKAGLFHLVLTSETKILSFHLNPSMGRGSGPMLLAEMNKHPKDDRWGIRNKTATPWTVLKEDGSTETVPPERTVPLWRNATFSLDGKTVRILS